MVCCRCRAGVRFEDLKVLYRKTKRAPGVVHAQSGPSLSPTTRRFRVTLAPVGLPSVEHLVTSEQELARAIRGVLQGLAAIHKVRKEGGDCAGSGATSRRAGHRESVRSLRRGTNSGLPMLLHDRESPTLRPVCYSFSLRPSFPWASRLGLFIETFVGRTSPAMPAGHIFSSTSSSPGPRAPQCISGG